MTLAQIRRSLLAAGLVGLVATHNVAVLQRRPAAELVIEMKASVPSQAKAYFDTGRGFNEAETAAKAVSPGPFAQQLFFSMPTKTIRSIRFDPLETSGTLTISDAFIQRPRTHILLYRFDLSQIASGNEISSLVFRDGNLEVTTAGQSTDSQLILP